MIDKDRVVESFFRYVKIDSESGNEMQFSNCLKAEFSALGCETYTDDSGKSAGWASGNLLCTFKGEDTLPPIMLCAHMDTVKPGNGIEPILCEDGFIRSAGDTILAADDKVGIAAIYEAILSIKNAGAKHRTIEVFFTVGEELGMVGAKGMDYSKIISKSGVVLDSSGDVGNIVLSAPGQSKLEVDIIGKSAHAGIAPEQGISAIQVAAEAVSNMKLLRVDEETTANIGTFTAVNATNIVAEKVYLMAECRSRNAEKLTAQSEHMLSCVKNACEKYGAKYTGGLKESYLSYNFSSDDEFIKEIAAACSAVGAAPTYISTGGGSDANIMNKIGIKSVVLGTGMSKVHTCDEEVSVKNLVKLTELIYELIKV